MSMNLVKILDDLKNLPNQAIMSYANGSNPEVPPYVALAELNRRKAMEQQYQAAGAKTGQPSVKEQVEQAVVKPGQASPQPQGIAAAMPQGAPQGAPQPPQPVPATQSAGVPQMKKGGIASFAAGGQANQSAQAQAQASQQLAQLMQAINQSVIQAPPQQTDAVAIDAPKNGQAMPMQNYAALQFATRPQMRPGTEAAPNTQDLSFSQMGQYSSQQPIAAAHGGLMHHVPHHMFNFAHGGILAFAEGDKVPNAAKKAAEELSGQPDPGIIPGTTYSDALAAVTPQPQQPVAVDPNSWQGQVGQRLSNIGANVSNNVSGIGNTLKSAGNAVVGAYQNYKSARDQASDPNFQGVQLPTQPAPQPPAQPVAQTAAQPTNQPASQTAPSQQTTIPNPLQLPPTGAGAGIQGGPTVAQANSSNPPPAPPAPPSSRGILNALPAKPVAQKLDTLDDEANKQMADKLREKTSLKDQFEVADAIAKHYGTDTPAGQIALKKLEEIQQEHMRNKEANKMNDLIAVLHGFSQGRGGAAENYLNLQHQHQAEEQKHLMDQLEIMDAIDKRNREEKIKNGESVFKAYAKAYEQAQSNKRSAAQLAEEARGHNLTAAAEAARLAKMDKSVQEIAKMPPAEQEAYRLAQQIKSGASTKLDLQAVSALLSTAQKAYNAALATMDDDKIAAAKKDYDEARMMMRNVSQNKDPYAGISENANVAPPVPQDKSKLVVGQKYTGSNGLVAKWNGTKFVAE